MGLEAREAFVGRSGELGELLSVLDLARRSEPQLVLIEADAGMGKTSLVRHFLATLEDVVICEADSDESESSLEYGMISQLVGSMGDEAVRTLPLLASGPPGSADPFSVGAELVQGVGVMQGEGGVLVLVLDDMQWADIPSARALLFTVRRLRHDRVLVVLTARPAALQRLGDSWQRLLQDRSRVHRLQLDGLRPSEIQELAMRLGLDPLSTGTAERLMHHTGGHPLYLRALLEELPAEALRSGAASLPAPRSLAATVISRLGGMSDSAQELVGAAAVLGQRCPIRLAVTLAGLTDGVDSLEEATEARLLEARPTGSNEEVGFVHPLLRAAVYGDLSPTRRRDLHGKAASLVPASAALSHRVAATPGCDEELAKELEEMAQSEAATGQTSLATDHFLMAADLSSDRALREQRFLAAIHVMIVAGHEVRVREAKGSIEACADGTAKSYALGFLAMQCGQMAEAEAHLEEAIANAPVPSHVSYGGMASISLAVLNLLRGESEPATRWAQHALDHAGDDPVVEAFGRLPLAAGLAISGKLAEGLAALKAPSPKLDRPRAFEANLLCEGGILRLWANDVFGAVEDLSTSLRWSRSGTPVRNLSSLYGSLADAQYRIGEWDKAVVNAELAVSLAQDLDLIYDRPMAHAVAAYVQSGRGEWNLAARHAHRARECAVLAPSAASSLFAALAEATIAQTRGHHDATLSALESGLDGPIRPYLESMDLTPWRVLHADALIGIGRLDDADEAVGALEGMAAARPFPATRLQAFRLRGALEDAKGEDDAAQNAFAQGYSIAEQSRLPFAQARLEIEHGRFLRRSGERRHAIARLQSARDRLLSMGARPYLELCDWELTACGLRGGARGAGSPIGLTPREQSIAHLVASGLSNPEAAAELYVSTKTVEYHLSNVFAKLNISSRRQLGAALVEYRS